MAYSIEYADDAIEDLKEIAAHYKTINPALKVKFKQKITEAEKKMLQNPFAFSYTGYKKFRKINLAIFPYKIIYVNEQYTIRVFGVFHHARSKRFIRNRLR